MGHGAQEAEVRRGRGAEGIELGTLLNSPLLPCSPAPLLPCSLISPIPPSYRPRVFTTGYSWVLKAWAAR
jgi:hypothetical protein